MFVLKDHHSEKYLGGELTMWMDKYCATNHCGNNNNHPKAYWMFQQKYDKEFTKSVLGMVGIYASLYCVIWQSHVIEDLQHDVNHRNC